MVKLKRHELAAEAARRNRAQLAVVGGQVRAARHRRGWTQQQLGARVGLSRSAVSAIERGLGGSHTVDTWQRVAVALDIPLRVELGRDPDEPLADAGHLRIQELVLRLARDAGFAGSSSCRPGRSTRGTRPTVGSLDRGLRRLIIAECWNTIGYMGAGARSTNRKIADAHAFAVSVFGAGPVEIGACWVVRDTRRNRALFETYPEVIRARFPGFLRCMGGGIDSRRTDPLAARSRLVRPQCDAELTPDAPSPSPGDDRASRASCMDAGSSPRAGIPPREAPIWVLVTP